MLERAETAGDGGRPRRPVPRVWRVLRDRIDNQGNGAVFVDLRDVAGIDPGLKKMEEN